MEEGKDVEHSRATASSVMPLPKSPSTQYEENGREEEGFHNALLELKDLRSQLHHAAEHCERAFSTAQQKKMILEGTKSYICEAVVAIVDHLGTVSSKLEQSLLANAVVKQTEQRIGCLKQRILACQQYAMCLELCSMQLDIKFPQHHQHYVSPGADFAKAIPVLAKPSKPACRCKTEDLHVLAGVYQKKKPKQVNNFLSFIGVSKRKI
ncbi:probable protein ABIL5 isoform X1 [Zingiber officinale]|uniref:Protein ABIL5 n=1 Tax=Zingiber officinale TaxID=94328 RepID=A0A8J5LRB9_ZINOF|nr:probable protein ABIL5 isoform X1 [Zingiber officinale]KAG6531134.1 hypothetical protein ZIOFF_004906 [Zingiber officinale]